MGPQPLFGIPSEAIQVSREVWEFAKLGWGSALREYMSYSLNSLRGVIYEMPWGSIIRPLKGDSRSLDYSSYHNNPTEAGNLPS